MMLRGSAVIGMVLAVACAKEIEPGFSDIPDSSFMVAAGGTETSGTASGGEEPTVGGAMAVAGAFDVGSGGTMEPPPMPTECPPNQKRCGGICVTPAPLVGCSLTGCASCPEAPAGAIAICNGDQCGIDCPEGFVMANGTCVEDPGGMGQGGAFDPGGSQSCSFSKGDACTECACQRCSSQVSACTTSGAPCTDILDCGVRSKCASTDCYCGMSLLCLNPTGPCVQVIQTAGGTTDGLEIQGFQMDPSHPIGQADAASLCMEARCATECGL